MARVFDHADAEELAEYADVPVINGLTDDAHPCQTLADLLTIRARSAIRGRAGAWVGDGNNVGQSFVIGARWSASTSPSPRRRVRHLEEVADRAAGFGNAPETTHDPEAAVAGADVVYPDVWVDGPGGRTRRENRRLRGLSSDEGLLAETAVDALSARPPRRGDHRRCLESENAVVWDQAENRLHAQKGLLVWLSEQA